MVKGPGPVDTRFSDGGTPTTYPSDGNSFLLPLAPPYDTVTVVTCGATWSYFKPGGVLQMSWSIAERVTQGSGFLCDLRGHVAVALLSFAVPHSGKCSRRWSMQGPRRLIHGSALTG